MTPINRYAAPQERGNTNAVQVYTNPPVMNVNKRAVNHISKAVRDVVAVENLNNDADKKTARSYFFAAAAIAAVVVGSLLCAGVLIGATCSGYGAIVIGLGALIAYNAYKDNREAAKKIAMANEIATVHKDAETIRIGRAIERTQALRPAEARPESLSDRPNESKRDAPESHAKRISSAFPE